MHNPSASPRRSRASSTEELLDQALAELNGNLAAALDVELVAAAHVVAGEDQEAYQALLGELRTKKWQKVEERWPQRPQAGSTTWAPIDVNPALEGAGPEPASILARTDGLCLLYPGRIHTFYGEPETAKSWLALWACAEQLRAGSAVLYIDFEDNEWVIIRRLLDLGLAAEVIRERFTYLRPEEPLRTNCEPDLARAVAGEPILIVLDGVTEAMVIHGLDLRDNTDVAEFMRIPRRLAQGGAAVLLLDHVVKDRESRGRFAIGGQAKLAGIDGAAYSLETALPFARGRDGLVVMKLAKDRLGHILGHADEGRRVAEVVLRSLDNGAVEVAVQPPASRGVFRPTTLMERVSKALEETAGGLSGRGIRAAVAGNTDAKRLAVELLISEGYIVVERVGRADLHRSIRPYRAAEESNGPTVPEWSHDGPKDHSEVMVPRSLVVHKDHQDRDHSASPPPLVASEGGWDRSPGEDEALANLLEEFPDATVERYAPGDGRTAEGEGGPE